MKSPFAKTASNSRVPSIPMDRLLGLCRRMGADAQARFSAHPAIQAAAEALVKSVEDADDLAADACAAVGRAASAREAADALWEDVSDRVYAFQRLMVGRCALGDAAMFDLHRSVLPIGPKQVVEAPADERVEAVRGFRQRLLLAMPSGVHPAIHAQVDGLLVSIAAFSAGEEQARREIVALASQRRGLEGARWAVEAALKRLEQAVEAEAYGGLSAADWRAPLDALHHSRALDRLISDLEE